MTHSGLVGANGKSGVAVCVEGTVSTRWCVDGTMGKQQVRITLQWCCDLGRTQPFRDRSELGTRRRSRWLAAHASEASFRNRITLLTGRSISDVDAESVALSQTRAETALGRRAWGVQGRLGDRVRNRTTCH